MDRGRTVAFAALLALGCSDRSPRRLATTYFSEPEQRAALVSQRAKAALGDLVAVSEPKLANPDCREMKTDNAEFARVLCKGTSSEGKAEEIGLLFTREGEHWTAVPGYAHNQQVAALVDAEKWDEACAQVDRFMAFAPFGQTNWVTKMDCLLRVAATDQKQHKAKLAEAKTWAGKIKTAYPDPEDAKLVEYVSNRVAYVEANPPFAVPPLSLKQVKGDAARLVGRRALIYGFVTSSDYFNYGYMKMRGTMFSFDVTDIRDNGQPGFDRIHVYADKEKFQDFFDKVSASQEPKLATFVITLPGERYDKGSSSEFSVVDAALGRSVDLNPLPLGAIHSGDASKSWSARFKMSGARGDQPVSGRLRALGSRLRFEVDGFKFVHIVDVQSQTTWAFDPTAAKPYVWESPTADIGLTKQSLRCAERRDECYSEAGLAPKATEVIDGVDCEVLENAKSAVFQKLWKRSVVHTVWRPVGEPRVPFLRSRVGWIECNLSEVAMGKESPEAFLIPDGARVVRAAAAINLRDEEFPEFELLKGSLGDWMNLVLKSALPPP